MKLTKKESARIATLINELHVSDIMFRSAKDNNEINNMTKYNNHNNIAIIALYDEFKIKLCTYDIAIKNMQN